MTNTPAQNLIISLCALTLTTATVQAGGGTGTADVKKGLAKLAFSAEAIAALNDADIFVEKISPGSVNFRTAVVSVPLVSGAIDTNSARIELASSGGFGFSKDDQRLTIIDLVTSITDGTAGSVTALLTSQGDFQGRIKIADFTVNIPTPIPTRTDRLAIEDISLKLSAEAAAALNAAFGTTVFQPGQELARATLNAKIAGKRL